MDKMITLFFQFQVEIITRTVESFYHCLHDHGSFHPPGSDSFATEPPSAELWVLFFLVRHYTTIGNTQKAMEYVDIAIEHTPTMMELYMIKAKVYKVYIVVISIFNVFSGN